MVLQDTFEHDAVIGFKFGYSPIGKPNLFVYAYYVDGLLIDTCQRKVRAQLLSATQKLNIDQLFLTHHHEDHTGNISDLRREHHCPVFASNRTCQLMKNPPSLSFIQKLMYGSRSADDQLIPKDNSVDTKRFRFEIIPIPGHAEDMVCLYEPEKKWLFSSDLFINTRISFMLTDERISDQIRSIQKVLKLDFDVLFCSHNPQLTNGKGQLIRKLEFLESFQKQVNVLHRTGCSANEIFKRMHLKEKWLIKWLSGGKLSKMNMIKSVIRDLNIYIE